MSGVLPPNTYGHLPAGWIWKPLADLILLRDQMTDRARLKDGEQLLLHSPDFAVPVIQRTDQLPQQLLSVAQDDILYSESEVRLVSDAGGRPQVASGFLCFTVLPGVNREFVSLILMTPHVHNRMYSRGAGLRRRIADARRQVADLRVAMPVSPVVQRNLAAYITPLLENVRQLLTAVETNRKHLRQLRGHSAWPTRQLRDEVQVVSKLNDYNAEALRSLEQSILVQFSRGDL